MSKFSNYLKANRYDILASVMSANASTNGTASDWKQIAQLKERK